MAQVWEILEKAVQMFPQGTFRLVRRPKAKTATLYYNKKATIRWKEQTTDGGQCLLLGKFPPWEFSFLVAEDTEPEHLALQFLLLALYLEIRRKHPQLEIYPQPTYFIGGTLYISQKGMPLAEIDVTPDWTVQVLLDEHGWEFFAPPTTLPALAETIPNILLPPNSRTTSTRKN